LTSTAPVTFVVRFWRETSAGQGRWRGQIEHVQSGRRRSFLEMQEMLEFLEGFGIGTGHPPAGRSAEDGRHKGS
jgi:hypothetical protein